MSSSDPSQYATYRSSSSSAADPMNTYPPLPPAFAPTPAPSAPAPSCPAYQPQRPYEGYPGTPTPQPQYQGNILTYDQPSGIHPGHYRHLHAATPRPQDLPLSLNTNDLARLPDGNTLSNTPPDGPHNFISRQPIKVDSYRPGTPAAIRPAFPTPQSTGDGEGPKSGTSVFMQNARDRQQRTNVGEKILQGLSGLENHLTAVNTRLDGFEIVFKAFRDQLHDVQEVQKSLPTKSDVAEEIAAQLSSASPEQTTTIVEALIPQLMVVLSNNSKDLLRDLKETIIQSVGSARLKDTSNLTEVLSTMLNPLTVGLDNLTKLSQLGSSLKTLPDFTQKLSNVETKLQQLSDRFLMGPKARRTIPQPLRTTVSTTTTEGVDSLESMSQPTSRQPQKEDNSKGGNGGNSGSPANPLHQPPGEPAQSVPSPELSKKNDHIPMSPLSSTRAQPEKRKLDHIYFPDPPVTRAATKRHKSATPSPDSTGGVRDSSEPEVPPGVSQPQIAAIRPHGENPSKSQNEDRQPQDGPSMAPRQFTASHQMDNPQSVRASITRESSQASGTSAQDPIVLESCSSEESVPATNPAGSPAKARAITTSSASKGKSKSSSKFSNGPLPIVPYYPKRKAKKAPTATTSTSKSKGSTNKNITTSHPLASNHPRRKTSSSTNARRPDSNSLRQWLQQEPTTEQHKLNAHSALLASQAAQDIGPGGSAGKAVASGDSKKKEQHLAGVDSLILEAFQGHEDTNEDTQLQTQFPQTPPCGPTQMTNQSPPRDRTTLATQSLTNLAMSPNDAYGQGKGAISRLSSTYSGDDTQTSLPVDAGSGRTTPQKTYGGKATRTPIMKGSPSHRRTNGKRRTDLTKQFDILAEEW